MKAAWLVHICSLCSGNASMDECRGYVTLDKNEIQCGRQNHHNANRWPHNNRCPSFKIVNSFYLSVPSCTKVCFKFLDTTIQVMLDFEGPRAWQDIFTRVWNVAPAIKFADEGMEFHSHHLPELCLKRTACGSVKRWIVFIIFWCLGSRFKEAWIRNIIEMVCIQFPWIQTQVFRHHSQASGIIEPGVLQQIAFSEKVLQKILLWVILSHTTSICNGSNRMLPIADDISMEGKIVWLPIDWESLQFSRAILVGSHILSKTTGGNILWSSGSSCDCITFITVDSIVSPWSHKWKGGWAVPVALWWEWKWDLWWERKWEILWDFDRWEMCWLECMGSYNKLVTCIKLNVRSRIVGWFYGLGILIRLDNVGQR